MIENNLGFHCNRLRYFDEAITENGLNRGEFFNFHPEEIPALKQKLLSTGVNRSIHSPLIKPDWYPDPPTWSFLCDVDKYSRKRTFKMVTETLAHAEDIGAEYVIVHFPVLCTDGSDEREDKLKSIAWKSCDELAELSVKRGVEIHIEGLGNSPYLNDGFLIKALGQYPLRYCFDTGHMNLASQINGFDLYQFAEEIRPFVGSIHLWNNRGHNDYLDFRHVSIHPSQEPEEGWADIKKLLEVLKPDYPVIFESPLSYPETLGDHDYRDGVKWVKEILATSS
ncbi:MAG: sugar phosphate isomerase/epimerase [Chloroflexota bacterium]|nr:sugar phosphate isomerase/epimerase [Chloroflexota bacterium]